METRELKIIEPPDEGCAAEVCESCGAAFACGASDSTCWCAGVKLDEAARAELRARFRRCLCRACLGAYAARAAEGRADV